MRIAPDTARSAKMADNKVATSDGKWWEVRECLGNNRFNCVPLNTATMSTRDLGLNLPWEKVGVRRY